MAYSEEVEIREVQLGNTEYKYIPGRDYVIFSNNVTLTMDEFKEFHSKGILVKKVGTLARVPQRLSNYQIALETGVMTPLYLPAKVKLQHHIPKKKHKKQEKHEPLPEVIELPASEPEQKRKIILPKTKDQIILFCMLFIAVGSALMSVYHMTTFLNNAGKPMIVAFMTALFFVTFTSVGFTAARYFSERPGFAKIFALPFTAITSIIICYIAFSTTSVSYEQFRDEEKLKSTQVQKEIGSLELYKDMQKSITETEKYIRTLEKVNPDSVTKEAYARNQKMLTSEREKLQALRTKAYSLKENSGGGTIEEKQASIASIYDFLTQIFGVNSRILRFIIYVIPAVFYDIVAPFGFTVVFFLNDKKGEEDNANAI